ncbi:hypothetical protein [Bacillus kwashiorkori]|uniref:hypothetical protein n=1 Tax=Bacillus kwashiorkori TaxID=1522318 RepID=UPI000780FD9E|nr:hypothetical protein [Bacillus kwashiorkori]
MIKKLITREESSSKWTGIILVMVTMLLASWLFGGISEVSANGTNGKQECKMTIDLSKHTYSSPAYADGICGEPNYKDAIFGYYSQDGRIVVMYTGLFDYITKNGQQLDVGIPFLDVVLTVYYVEGTPDKPKEEQPSTPPKEEKPKEEQPTNPPKEEKTNNPPKVEQPEEEVKKPVTTSPTQNTGSQSKTSTSKLTPPSSESEGKRDTDKNETGTNKQKDSKNEVIVENEKDVEPEIQEDDNGAIEPEENDSNEIKDDEEQLSEQVNDDPTDLDVTEQVSGEMEKTETSSWGTFSWIVVILLLLGLGFSIYYFIRKKRN